MSAVEALPFRGGRVPILFGSLLGAGGGGLLVIGFVVDPRQALFSYLIAYAYLFAITVGAIGFVIAMHAAGAVWPTVVRRLAETMMSLVPLLAFLALPVLAGAGYLYPWMHIEAIERPEVREVLEHRHSYMNLGFFIGRAALYFALLLAISIPLCVWSKRLDRPGPERALGALKARMRVLSAAALPVVAVFGTMAAWDWLLSLSPTWTSTMFGLGYLAGGFVAALGVLSLATVIARRAGYLPDVGESHLYALGRMMFAFLVFWAYTAYFQFMLSWIANKPKEAEWFWQRMVGGYGAEGIFLIFGVFGAPFLVMLSYWVKRQAWGIGAVGAWIAISQYFPVHWVVAAARGRSQPWSWMDLAAVLFVGGFGVAFAVWRQRGQPLVPVHDPSLPRAAEYSSR